MTYLIESGNDKLFRQLETGSPEVKAYPFYFIVCFLGCLLLPLTVLTIIRLEKNYQSYLQYLRQLGKDVKMINPVMPLVTDNFKVCLLTGDCINTL